MCERLQRWIGASLLLLCSAAAGLAAAQQGAGATDDPEQAARALQAKRLFDEGVELLAAEQWADAEARFRSSVELVPRASSLYNLALSLLELGRYAECIETTERVLALADPIAQDEYRQYAMQLRERAVAARAQVQAAAAAEPQPAPVAAAASQPVRARANRPVPAREPVERASRTPAWFVAGGGAALLAGALVTGLLAMNEDADFSERCPTGRGCDPALRSVAERAEGLALATDILLVAGAATLGTGITLLLLHDDDADAMRGAALVLGGRFQ